MKPNLANITSFRIILKAKWHKRPVQPSPLLTWAEDMKDMCPVCPLACFPHPMVTESDNSNSFAKLCTRTVIAAGFLDWGEIKDDGKVCADAPDTGIVSEKQPFVTETQQIVPEKPQIVQEALIFTYKHCSGPQYAATAKKPQKRPQKTPGTILQLTLFECQGQNPPEETLSPFQTIENFQKKGLSRDEAKILYAGFCLVRYIREEKKIQVLMPSDLKTCSWRELKSSPFLTFASAERKLTEILKDPKFIQITENGTVSNGQNIKKLTPVGFEFYRSEGIIPGHGTPRIKCFSKNWGNWKKFASAAEVVSAWDELMKDEKALIG